MVDAVNPYYEPEPKQPWLSPRERRDLSLAIGLLSLAFAFFLADSRDPFGRLEMLFAFPQLLITSFLAVTSGFVLHELAHKIVAQRFGCWAEFRAQPGFLGIGVLVAWFTGFLAVLPGAVMILGRINQRENGLISIAGPATNLVLALVLSPFAWLTQDALDVPHMLSIVALINVGLAIFNLLPFGPLDGKKVFRWNPFVWGGFLGASIMLAVFLFSRVRLDYV